MQLARAARQGLNAPGPPAGPPPRFAQRRALTAVANLVFIAEADDYLVRFERLTLAAKLRGGAMHDARVAAICLSRGVTERWLADRDFSRFPAPKTRNPLIR